MSLLVMGTGYHFFLENRFQKISKSCFEKHKNWNQKIDQMQFTLSRWETVAAKCVHAQFPPIVKTPQGYSWYRIRYQETLSQDMQWPHLVQMSSDYNFSAGEELLFCDGYHFNSNNVLRVQFDPREHRSILELNPNRVSVNYSRNAHVVVIEELKTLILPKENAKIDVKEDVPGSLPRTIFYDLDDFSIDITPYKDAGYNVEFSIREGSCSFSRSLQLYGYGHDIDFGYYFAKR